MVIGQFKNLSDMRRGQWALKMATERHRHAYKEWTTTYKKYREALDEALTHYDFFEDFIKEALDCHAVWHLHRKGKHLSLEIECEELGYKSVLLSWWQFEVIIKELELRGMPVE